LANCWVKSVVVVRAADINKDLLSSMVAMEDSLLTASSLNMANNKGTVNNRAMVVDTPSRATDLLVVDMEADTVAEAEAAISKDHRSREVWGWLEEQHWVSVVV